MFYTLDIADPRLQAYDVSDDETAGRTSRRLYSTPAHQSRATSPHHSLAKRGFAVGTRRAVIYGFR